MFIFLILILIIFILGCQPAQEAEKFDINLIKGTGFAYEGKTLLEGENFRIGLELINYYKDEKTGVICVYDNQHSYYGGIERECGNFYVSGYQQYEKEKKPGISKIYFPRDGYFSYINLPVDINPEIYIEITYPQKNQFVTTLTYPSPEIESFSFSDDTLSIHVSKSIHQASSNYEILLEIKIEKRRNVNISIEEKSNFIYFNIEAKPLTFSCTSGKTSFIQSAIINLEKENFIRCKTLTNSMNQESLPLIINTNYKIKETKKIKINVKKIE